MDGNGEPRVNSNGWSEDGIGWAALGLAVVVAGVCGVWGAALGAEALAALIGPIPAVGLALGVTVAIVAGIVALARKGRPKPAPAVEAKPWPQRAKEAGETALGFALLGVAGWIWSELRLELGGGWALAAMFGGIVGLCAAWGVLRWLGVVGCVAVATFGGIWAAAGLVPALLVAILITLAVIAARMR